MAIGVTSRPTRRHGAGHGYGHGIQLEALDDESLARTSTSCVTSAARSRRSSGRPR